MVQVVGVDRRRVACPQTRTWQLLKLVEQAYLAARRAVRAAVDGRFEAGAWGVGLGQKCKGLKAESWSTRLARWCHTVAAPSLEGLEAFDSELSQLQEEAEEARRSAVAARSASWRKWADLVLAGGASQGHRFVKGQEACSEWGPVAHR